MTVYTLLQWSTDNEASVEVFTTMAEAKTAMAALCKGEKINDLAEYAVNVHIGDVDVFAKIQTHTLSGAMTAGKGSSIDQTKIVQLVSHRGELWALTESGALFRVDDGVLIQQWIKRKGWVGTEKQRRASKKNIRVALKAK